MTRIKICGITRLEDALVCSDLGAFALGFIFYKKSKRFINPTKAKKIIERLPAFILKVGVFVNESAENIIKIFDYCGLDRVQVYSDDETFFKSLPANKVIKVFRVKNEADIKKAEKSKYFPLFDKYDEKAFGGTGKNFEWSILKNFNKYYILAGGINPKNIKNALKLNPYAIDISSGVELAPGIKDKKKLFDIFRVLRENQSL